MAAETGSGREPAWRKYVEGAVWLILAGGAYALTFDFDGPLRNFELGPAFWPRLLIAGIAIAAAGLIVGTWVQRARHRHEAARPGGAEAPAQTNVVVKAKTVAVLAVPVLYVFLMHQLGFYLVTPVFLAGYMWLLGVRRWTTLVAVTVGLYAVILVVFVNLIFTPLPQGAGVFYTINGKLMGFLQ